MSYNVGQGGDAPPPERIKLTETAIWVIAFVLSVVAWLIFAGLEAEHLTPKAAASNKGAARTPPAAPAQSVVEFKRPQAQPVASARALPTTPANAVGVWSGTVEEGSKRYPVVMTLDPTGGSTVYRTLNCSGYLSIADTNGEWSLYREKVTNGPGARCIDGYWAVQTQGNGLRAAWMRSRNARPRAHSFLTRDTR